VLAGQLGPFTALHKFMPDLHKASMQKFNSLFDQKQQKPATVVRLVYMFVEKHKN